MRNGQSMWIPILLAAALWPATIAVQERAPRNPSSEQPQRARRDSLPAGAPGVQGGAAQRPPAQDDARITFDVKEADIADVVRVLAEVGSFQVVMDPGVTCKLTLRLKEVRWPAVLEMALRSCGLGHEEDDGVVRIAPVARLAEEHGARRRLEEARELAAPRTLTSYRLSYARAEQLAPILKKMLPPGAEVIFDSRTNTLIVIQ